MGSKGDNQGSDPLSGADVEYNDAYIALEKMPPEIQEMVVDGWKLAYAHVLNGVVHVSLYRRKVDGGTSQPAP